MSKYKKNDEFEILSLFKEAFNREMSLEYWKWRYDNEIINEKYINLMWEGQTLAAHYAVVPINLSIGSMEIKTGFSMTTMTGNKYKGLGMFKKLASDLYNQNYNELTLIWGFPNENSIHGFLKYLQWRNIADISMYQINLDDFYCTNFNNINEIIRFDNNIDSLCEEANSKYKILVKRDSKYLNWRYCDNTTNKYYILTYNKGDKITAYSIYKFYEAGGETQGDIVEILAQDVESFNEIIIATLGKLKLRNVVLANIWMNDKEYVKELINIGFTKSNIITHFGVKINGEFNDSDEIFNFDNWYVTMGDSDVF